MIIQSPRPIKPEIPLIIKCCSINPDNPTSLCRSKSRLSRLNLLNRFVISAIMMEQQETYIFDALVAIIHTFSPGISQLIRLILVMLGIDLLSYSFYVCLLLAMPALFTFILLRTFTFLKPCFQIFISSTEIQYRNNLYPQVTKWMSTVKFYS